MILELYPIFIMLSIFAKQLANTHVVFHSDNLDNVYILNKKTSGNDSVMHIVRPIMLVLLVNNINLTARHIPGKNNILCDVLSRFQVTGKLLKESNMQPHPLQIPTHLLPENFAPLNRHLPGHR